MDSTYLEKLIKASIPRKGVLIEERLEQLDPRHAAFLSHLVVILEHLNPEDIYKFLEICGFKITNEEILKLLEVGIIDNLIEPQLSNGGLIPFFRVTDQLRKHLWNRLTTEEQIQRHLRAVDFYRNQFIDAIKLIYKDSEPVLQMLDSDEGISNLIIQPGGFIDLGAHCPQVPEFHNWSIMRAYYWQEHLFASGQLDDAAHLTNSICFALARKGHKNIAKKILLRNALATRGLEQSVALVNLGTILRDDKQHKLALQFYRRALFPLLFRRALPQLAGLLSEVSNVHRDFGHICRAIFYQHTSGLIRRIIKDDKGKAICNNQLSILYRTLKLYRLSFRYSKAAETYWRISEDEVNLAKTLLTQGNIYNHMRQPTNAMKCFDESVEINLRIENYPEAASSLSGKARAHLQLGDFGEAKELLEDAISLRKRFDIKSIGIEYENMGCLFEMQGNTLQALGWY